MSERLKAPRDGSEIGRETAYTEAKRRSNEKGLGGNQGCRSVTRRAAHWLKALVARRARCRRLALAVMYSDEHRWLVCGSKVLFGSPPTSVASGDGSV